MAQPTKAPKTGNAPLPPTDANAVRSMCIRADRLMADQKLDEAESILDEGLKTAPHVAELVRRRADVDLRRGNRDAAAKRLKSFMSRAKGRTLGLMRVAAQTARSMSDADWGREVLREALDLYPNDAELNFEIGLLLDDAGRTDDAIRRFTVAVNMKPGYVQGMVALGYALEKNKDLNRALTVLRRAVGIEPRNHRILVNLGNVLLHLEKFDEGKAIYKRAMEVGFRPFLLSNLGSLLRKSGAFEAAERALRKAVLAEPENSGSLYNLGNLLKETGRPDEAAAMYRLAISIAPEQGSLHWNRALALLGAGRLEEGFQEYEWRWQYEDFPSRDRHFKEPMWDGTGLDGKTLLVHAEQGVGDILQFLRFLPPLLDRVGPDCRVVVEAHPELMRLLAPLSASVTLVERLSPDTGPFDVQVALISLPYVLGTKTFDDLPVEVPYLPLPEGDAFPIPELDASKLKVGIVWGGNPKFSGDRFRSTNLETYAPLFDVVGVQFFCLQKGPREPEIADAPDHVVRLNERIDDFADTASIVQQLDLVITTCTSMAHLSAAYGRPTWVVLGHNPDWRWHYEREDSPWYPTARVFRQPKPHDWAGMSVLLREALVEEVAARLREPVESA